MKMRLLGTPCALFAIGLSLSVEGIRSNLMASIVLAVVKLVITADGVSGSHSQST